MNNDEIKRELKRLKDASTMTINNLNEYKEEYKNMKNKIENTVLPKLKNAKSSINQAKTNLKNNYSSEEATKKCKNLQNCVDNINSLINGLNNSVLPEINNKINSMNNQINSEKASIEKYNNQLNQRS